MQRFLRDSRSWSVFLLIFISIVGGMYLWRMRGALGFRGEASFPVEIRTASGVVDIICSIQTPILANRRSTLSCEVRAFTSEVPVPQGPVDVGLTVAGEGFVVSPSDQHVTLNFGGSRALAFTVTPLTSGDQKLIVGLSAGGVTRAAQWPISIELKPFEVFLTALLFSIPLVLTYGGLREVRELKRVREKLARDRIAEAESKAERAPEKAKFAWELAAARLEAYFDRNLSQVNQVFWLAVGVTVTGFGFLLWAILASLNQQQLTARALVAGVAGAISQFIGATFLVIYRSIMAQANEFIWVLERINTVGMAVQVLDSIPEESAELKNETRSKVVALLLGAISSGKPSGSS